MKRCVRSCGRHNAGCRELFGGTPVISGFIWIFMIAIHICIIVLMNTEIRVKAAIGVAVSAAAAIIYFRYPENTAWVMDKLKCKYRPVKMENMDISFREGKSRNVSEKGYGILCGTGSFPPVYAGLAEEIAEYSQSL